MTTQQMTLLDEPTLNQPVLYMAMELSNKQTPPAANCSTACFALNHQWHQEEQQAQQALEEWR